ncbi:MAG: ribbon-helix-helix protein, CopG family [Sphaerochaetaceae bacterium]|nr:ribbon-helix-helix protein, CopG family [Sphaerochaetaceae bacterium]
MGETIRFGVSMDKDLVELLDKLTKESNHDNRSETIRALVRKEIIEKESENNNREVIGIVTILYNNKTSLPRVSISPFPSLNIKANLQFHVDKEICSKILVVMGKGDEIRTWAQKLFSSPHIIGNLTFVATDELYGELIK